MSLPASGFIRVRSGPIFSLFLFVHLDLILSPPPLSLPSSFNGFDVLILERKRKASFKIDPHPIMVRIIKKQL